MVGSSLPSLDRLEAESPNWHGRGLGIGYSAGAGGRVPVTFLPLTLFGQALRHRPAGILALTEAFGWCALQPRP